MAIRKQTLPPLAISAFGILIALTFPCTVKALGIGEIVLKSSLGEPLLAQVDLSSVEPVEESCLSLVATDPHKSDAGGYLTEAQLSLKTEDGKQFVVISTRKSFNEAFARLQLQVKCSETGSIVKTLTILPDLAPISAPVALAKMDTPSAPPPSVAQDILAVASLPSTRKTHPKTEAHQPAKVTSPVDKRPPASARSSHKQDSESAFVLKLSGDTIDVSRIGKISAEERAFLLAKQKLLDADEQTANFLALQDQLMQLQNELGTIKAQLAQLGIAPSASSSVPNSPASMAANAALPKPVQPEKPPVVLKDNSELQDLLLIALGLALAILALWQGLRYYTKIKSRVANKSLQILEPIYDQEIDETPQPKTVTLPQPSVAGNFTAHASLDTPPAKVSAPILEEITPPFLQPIQDEANEDDSMLEEAGLYAAHGRPTKAIEILQEIIKRHPSNTEAWPLLLSIYSSLGKAAEFEKTAQAFLKHHHDSPSWRGIQALGRTFDQNNPLYVDHDSHIPASPLLPDSLERRHPIGDVLMDLGFLSQQDLQNCLDDFDPKKHGRFGGYLVTRKAITLAQLDQALLHQQGVDTEAKPATLPSLQDMENFLADFDPTRDGSVAEFLASRNAGTPEQLSQLLRHPEAPVVEEKSTDLPSLQDMENLLTDFDPTRDGSVAEFLASRNASTPGQLGQLLKKNTASAEAPKVAEPAPANIDTTLDFLLETTSEHPVLDLEFEPETGKDKPLDFEVESSPQTEEPQPKKNDKALDFEVELPLSTEEPQPKKDDTPLEFKVEFPAPTEEPSKKEEKPLEFDSSALSFPEINLDLLNTTPPADKKDS